MNIFEQITRKALTFETTKGHVQVQALWQMTLTSATSKYTLDEVSKTLLAKMKSSGQESLLSELQTDTDDQLRLDVLKHIINVKLAEKEAKENAEITKSHNRKIDELIAQKKDEALAGKSIEELEALKK